MRGGRPVFEGLSFSLDRGELLLLEGPNGAGKSTLLRLCAGLLLPSAGRVLWQGQPQIGRQTHYLGHALGLKRELTVRENLQFASILAGGGNGFDDAIAHMNLVAFIDLPVRMLSAGQRQRSALAVLFMTARPIWLLDEPEAGLDAASRQSLTAALQAHQETGGIALVATHNPGLFSASKILSFGD